MKTYHTKTQLNALLGLALLSACAIGGVTSAAAQDSATESESAVTLEAVEAAEPRETHGSSDPAAPEADHLQLKQEIKEEPEGFSNDQPFTGVEYGDLTPPLPGEDYEYLAAGSDDVEIISISNSEVGGDMPYDDKSISSSAELFQTDDASFTDVMEDRWKISFGIELIGYYDDNLFLTNENQTEDFILVISPFVAVGRGDVVQREDNFFSFSYQPAYLYFFDNTDESNFAHNALGEFMIDTGKTRFSGAVGYQKLTGSDNEVSGRAERDIYYAKLDATFNLSLKSAIVLEHETIITDFKDREVDSDEYIFRGFYNYGVTEKLSVGVGGVFGYLDVPQSNTQTYQQALINTKYTPSPKLAYTFRAGVELRQYEDGDRVSPTATFTTQWNPFVNTIVNAELFVRERNSTLFEAQNYSNYGVTLGLRQKLMQRFEFSLLAGYQILDYRSAFTGTELIREDEYFFTNVALAYRFREWISAEVFYQYRQNTSTSQPQEWENNQFGLRLALEF